MANSHKKTLRLFTIFKRVDSWSSSVGCYRPVIRALWLIGPISRKPCIPDKKLLWNTVRKSWSLFQNPSWKIAWSAPGREIMMTSYTAGNKTSLCRKPCIPDKKSYYGTLSGCHGRSFRSRHEKVRAALPGGEPTMTSYPAGITISLSRESRTAAKKSLSWSHGRYFRISHEKSHEALGEIAMTS